jgi:hypothetical protein
MSDRIDTAGSKLASAVTEDATVFSVETVRGPQWTTRQADMGFGIVIGDELAEVMTVTDISGTSTMQTFTVVRAVWGQARAYGPRESVRLSNPARLHIPDLPF